MTLINWLLFAAIVVVLSVTIFFSLRAYLKGKSQKSGKVARDVDLKDNVRYTKDKIIADKEGNANVSFVKEDIILTPRNPIVVSKDGAIKPGKYTLLASNETDKKFNVRIGLNVKEFKHGDEVVLAEGEKITPTTTTIILR